MDTIWVKNCIMKCLITLYNMKSIWMLISVPEDVLPTRAMSQLGRQMPWNKIGKSSFKKVREST